MSSHIDFLKSIDLQQLLQDKAWLVELRAKWRLMIPTDNEADDHVTSLIHLLDGLGDHIQDEVLPEDNGELEVFYVQDKYEPANLESITGYHNVSAYYAELLAQHYEEREQPSVLDIAQNFLSSDEYDVFDELFTRMGERAKQALHKYIEDNDLLGS